MSEPVTETVRQFLFREEAPDPTRPEPTDDHRAQAAMMLRERLRARGYVIDTDPEHSEPKPAMVNPDGESYRVLDNTPPRFDGWEIVWTASGHEAPKDPEQPLHGDWTPDGDYVAVVEPPEVVEQGGAVRVRHDADSDVTVRAWKMVEGTLQPVGYLFAQELTPNEVHVELMPGTTHVTVTPEAAEAAG